MTSHPFRCPLEMHPLHPTPNFGRVQEPSTQIARMLAVGSLLVTGWSSSGPSVPRTRRDVILAGAAALALPAPALAQRSALIPRSSKESTESFKAYQLSKPSEETEAFKAGLRVRVGLPRPRPRPSP